MSRLMLLTSVCVIGLTTAASAETIKFQAAMASKSEVPANASAGTGDAKATLDTATKVLQYTVTFKALTGPATAAHFHGPAASGANAGVAIPLGAKDPAAPITGSATLTDAQIKDLQAGLWYVNVHTAANPGGEIRGQVSRAP